jgi:hypothetical protein
MELLGTFIIFNIINVVIQTIKSICTIKCNKWIAAIVNAIAYGLYTYIVVLTVCELDLWIKIFTVAGANLIGVFLVKYFEEKKRKDKLWKIEVTIPIEEKEQMIEDCKYYHFSYNYIDIEKYAIFNFYCATQKNSQNVKCLLKSYNAKYFVAESKIL